MVPLRLPSLALVAAVVASASQAFAATPTNAGNRLTYLDNDDPFYPHRDFPKLITPQWVGEPGVEAVVILAIDDMRDTKRYETFLRPILERLKRMDGRAPVSIMVNIVTTNDAPQLEAWLKEGLSLDVHTLAHPCPLLQRGSFTNAANTYHGGVDLLASVPGNKPVAFRMPCCDSMNSPSPRFYAEMFNRASPNGHFLTIDSSVMCVPTTNDTSLPRELVLDAQGRERFRKYFPAQTNAVTRKSLANFGTWIEDYPYPYVINKVCWEFPAMVPSDWEAFNLHGPTNPITLADWKAALDAVVRKQGVFTWIFHPHGWSSAAQIVEFIDHAERTHGKKVKFLTFREAQERLDKNLLKGNPLRDARGGENGVRLLDVNNDGLMDVVVGNEVTRFCRLWNSEQRTWTEIAFPLMIGSNLTSRDNTGGEKHIAATEGRTRFSVLADDGKPSVLGLSLGGRQVRGRLSFWDFDGKEWVESAHRTNGIPGDVRTQMAFLPTRPSPPDTNSLTIEKLAQGFTPDTGVRFRDMDHDGICELIVANESQQAIFQWSEKDKAWWKLGAGWPKGVSFVDHAGRDNGVRFADANGDGFEDLLVSNEKGFSLHLYIATPRGNLGWAKGWTYKQREGKREPLTRPLATLSPSDGERAGVRGTSVESSARDIPSFVRDSEHRNNGAWFHRGQLFVQNEDTAHLPDVVHRMAFSDLLTGDEPPPSSPAGSLAAMQVRPGFKVELVASEPLVMDPVAFEWGADGRLWVVEMHDYPSGVPDRTQVAANAAGSPTSTAAAARPTMRPAGRVIFLEDTDGDGRYDKRAVFLDGLNFPNGVMPWRKGVLVSAAPDIVYAEDTDGDGRADVKRVLFTGFREGNQQHRINGFEFGLDGWVYAANGDSGGLIQRVGGVLSGPVTGNSPPIDIRGHDLRFKPDTGEIELVAGQTQFGRRRDDWGNWFGNNNPNWLWHYHVPIHYLKRNPQLVVKSTRTMLANYTPPNQVFTVGSRQQRFNWPDRVNEVTSANSPSPYRDDLFGPEFATSVFISEPANNVVHREVLEPDGVSFKSQRAPDEQKREFLASSDNWFRPTMLKTGPDGALYIADMYRLIIEHPEYFPEELKSRPDMRDGDDKGRIWRVVPEGKPLRKVPNLAKLNTTELVAAMDSPNGWQRDTVQRLLVDSGSATTGMSEIRPTPFRSPDARVRLQWLATLEACARAELTDLALCLKDPNPGVREFAVAIAERHMPSILARYNVASKQLAPAGNGAEAAKRNYGEGQVLEALIRLPQDESPRVRTQLAYSLGASDAPAAAAMLALLALKDPDSSPLQTAVLSSASKHAGEMLALVFEYGDPVRPASALIEQLMGLTVSGNDPNALLKPLAKVGTPEARGFAPWQFSALAGLVEALERRGSTLGKLSAGGSAELRGRISNLDRLFIQARADASLQSAIRNPQSASAATRLLARGPTEQDADIARLIALLHPTSPPEVQQAAMTSLKKLASPLVAESLLAKWNELMPAVRGEALSALLSRAEWTQSLLGAIEAGKLTASALGLAQQQVLLAHTQPAIRERAAKLFTRVNPDRAKVIERFKGVEALTGNAQRGGAVFGGLCGTCHRVGGGGRGGVGPDLGTVADKPVSQLLTAILDPSQAVDPAYVYYIGYTKDFRDVSGIIVAETPNSITLRNAGGQDDTVLRADLVELKTGGLSMMPEGLEANLNPQAMADLIAFIKSGAGAAPKRR
ncbi:MAG: c-type cytochrome [Verrucomicrobia bacterium]|nr:c-type cytochrome [Verrucomicrobiota bacterium]